MTLGVIGALIVEDQFLIAMDMEEILDAMGIRPAHLASSVAQALEILDAHPIGFALIDIRLTGETSEAIALRLRALGIPFMLVTGYEPASDPHRIPAFDGVPLLRKPYRLADLQQAIKALLEA